MIVDEAHSSQTGEAAKDLKRVLGGAAIARGGRGRGRGRGGRARRRRRTCSPARSQARGRPGEPLVLRVHRDAEGEDARALRHARRRRRRPRTGRSTSTRCGRRSRRASSSTCSPTTRPTRPTSGSRRRSADDPEYDTAQARRAIARFVTLHPHNLAQKAEIIVEHFRAHTAKKIGGRAKAMVVTSSRLHAVRYKQALDAYIARAGLRRRATRSSRSRARCSTRATSSPSRG